MNKIQKTVREKWYIVFVGGLLFLQAAVFLFFRENSYLAVHDNLDLFVTQLKMMKDTDTFFAKDAILPMLGGISRDTFGSEFSLYNILYYLFPVFWAYLIGYGLKIAIGIFSFCLLCKDIYKEKYDKYRPLVILTAAAFGMIPVFPAYGICFASIPLIVWLLRRIYRKPDIWLFVGVFCYPLVSYFSYFGFFILAYIVCAVIILWIKDKKFPKWIALSCLVLFVGYAVFEYRLFGEMLFSDTVTIRATMAEGNLSFGEIIKTMGDVFARTIFHAQDSHYYLVFWVCLFGIVCINLRYILKKEYKKILTDSCNLTLGFIVFNVVIYGLYEVEAIRELVAALVPPLTGFQFNRTLFFNSFLWYALLFLVLKRLYDLAEEDKFCLFTGKLCNINVSQRIKSMGKKAADLIAAAAVIIVMFMPQTYNDFYHTCYYHAYSFVKQTKAKDLNYREFFSEDLFDTIKEEIDYAGEWSVAYGMHPAVLQFNQIATLDGYLGFYSQEYKEDFRKVIAPALANNEWARDNFDNWGARAYLYSASGENTTLPYRNLELEDQNLSIDLQAFKDLGGKYIFSRVKISNQQELGLSLKGTYFGDNSPYVIYVYE